MKKINRSKESTVKQMCNMAKNLRNKINSEFASIGTTCIAFDKENIKPTYWLGDGTTAYNFKTWHECQDKYFELMKEIN